MFPEIQSFEIEFIFFKIPGINIITIASFFIKLFNYIGIKYGILNNLSSLYYEIRQYSQNNPFWSDEGGIMFF